MITMIRFQPQEMTIVVRMKKTKMAVIQQLLEILKDLKDRDQRDINRSASPLKKAENAYLIDTTDSDIEAVFEAAREFVSSKM